MCEDLQKELDGLVVLFAFPTIGKWHVDIKTTWLFSLYTNSSEGITQIIWIHS